MRADSERFNMFEKAADGANILANLEKRDAVVKKKESEIIEEPEEVKSYDSEDSLDRLELDISPAPQLQLKSMQSQSSQHMRKATDDFVNELLSENIEGPEDSFFKVKFDIFKLINKNEH